VSSGAQDYLEVRYADLRRPAIALFEQRMALKSIREKGQHNVSEAQIVRTIEDQRRVIVKAKRATLSARRRARSRNLPSVEILDRLAESESGTQTPDQEKEKIDYDNPVEAYDVEQW
jgi:putative transposase